MRAIHTIHVFDEDTGELTSFYETRTGHRLTPEEGARWAALEEDNFLDACRRDHAAWVAERARFVDEFIASLDRDAI